LDKNRDQQTIADLLDLELFQTTVSISFSYEHADFPGGKFFWSSPVDQFKM